MVKDINDILFLDFARMERLDMEFKNNFTKEDIIYLINKIIEIDNNYQKKVDFLHDGIFKPNFMDELDKLDTEKKYYENIAEKLTTYYKTDKTNKIDSNEKPMNPIKIGQKYIENRVGHQVVTNEINTIKQNIQLIPPSPPRKRFKPTYHDNDEDNDEDNVNLNVFSFTGGSLPSLSIPPSTPPRTLSTTPPTKRRGGAKKSKKQKRKPLHRKSKTRKKKSNKKRVKLISNK
jgi:hypothetical protein